METETIRVEVATEMSNLPPTLGFTSTVSIDLHEVVEELIEDESGTTLVGQYISPPPPISHVVLKPRWFTLHNLSRILRRQLHCETPICSFLAEEIATCRFSEPEYNTLPQKPFLMSVKVKFIREIRFILPSVSVPFDGASGDVFQRLLEEQTVESVCLDETCSICIDKLSESSSETSHQKNIIQMPNCSHLFHQNCIFEWLSRHNSCPLCRRVPYEEEEEDQETMETSF